MLARHHLETSNKLLQTQNQNHAHTLKKEQIADIFKILNINFTEHTRKTCNWSTTEKKSSAKGQRKQSFVCLTT